MGLSSAGSSNEVDKTIKDSIGAGWLKQSRPYFVMEKIVILCSNNTIWSRHGRHLAAALAEDGVHTVHAYSKGCVAPGSEFETLELKTSKSPRSLSKALLKAIAKSSSKKIVALDEMGAQAAGYSRHRNPQIQAIAYLPAMSPLASAGGFWKTFISLGPVIYALRGLSALCVSRKDTAQQLEAHGIASSTMLPAFYPLHIQPDACQPKAKARRVLRIADEQASVAICPDLVNDDGIIIPKASKKLLILPEGLSCPISPNSQRAPADYRKWISAIEALACMSDHPDPILITLCQSLGIPVFAKASPFVSAIDDGSLQIESTAQASLDRALSSSICGSSSEPSGNFAQFASQIRQALA